MSHLKAPICPFCPCKSLCLVHAVLNIFHLPFQTHLSCISSSPRAPRYWLLWTTSKAGVGWANRGHQQEIRGRQESLRPGTDSSSSSQWAGWLTVVASAKGSLHVALYFSVLPFYLCRSWGSSVSWTAAPQGHVHILVPTWICKCDLIWKKASADVIKLRILRWEDNSELSRWPMTNVLIRGRKRGIQQTEGGTVTMETNWSDMAQTADC